MATAYTVLQQNFASGELSPMVSAQPSSDVYSSGLSYAKNALFSQSGAVRKRTGTEYFKMNVPNLAASGEMLMATISVNAVPYLIVFTPGEDGGTDVTISPIGSELPYTFTTSSIDPAHIGEMDVQAFSTAIYVTERSMRPIRISMTVAEESPEWEASSTTEELAEAPEGVRTVSVGDLRLPSAWSAEEVEFKGIDFSSSGSRPKCQTFKGGRWLLGNTEEHPSMIWASRPFDDDGNERFSDFTMSDKYTRLTTYTRVMQVRDGGQYVKQGVRTYEYGDMSSHIPSGETSHDDYKYSTDNETWVDAPVEGTTYPYRQRTHYEKNYSYTCLEGLIASAETISDLTSSDYTQESHKDGDEAQLLSEGYALDGETGKYRKGSRANPSETYQKIGSDTDGATTTITTQSWHVAEVLDDVLPSHAIQLQEVDALGSELKWMTCQQRLLAGFGRSIWMDSGTVLTPEDFDLYKTLTVGNSQVKPIHFGQYVFFSGLNGRSVRAAQYSDDAGGFIEMDITAHSKTLFKDGVRTICAVDGDMPTLYVLTNAGDLLSCTMNSSTGQFGWSRVELEDGASVKAIASAEYEDVDWLFLVVEDESGTWLRRLSVRGEDDPDAVYMDDFSRVSYSEATSIVQVPSPYRGRTLSVICDGEYIGEYECQYGTFPYVDLGERSGKEFLVGFPYGFEVRTLNAQLPANGDSQGKARQISTQRGCLYNSLDFRVSAGNKRQEMRIGRLRYNSSAYGRYDDGYTGWAEIPCVTGVMQRIEETLSSDLPYPFCMVALSTEYSAKEE